MRKSDLDETRIGDARPARMQGLATLPVFFKLKGKRAIVAGGNDPALWKAELLAAAGADVAVYADDFADGFVALASSPPAGSVMLHRRSWRAADLDGAAIAIAASPDEADARTFAAAARSAGVPVNIIDRPAFCDFQFGAVVNRSPLVVAISTDGGAPVFGQSIRSLIEGLLPSGFKRWAEAAKVWRGQGDRLGATPTARRRFWERFADMAMRNAERAPTDADLEHLIGGATSSNETAPPVTFIGVGESTETLTLGALKALRQADFIVFDAGVPSAVLDFARREAHRVPLSVEKSTAAIDEMIAAATCNRSVVCLYRTASAADRAIEQMATALGTAGTRAIILECAKHARK